MRSNRLAGRAVIPFLAVLGCLGPLASAQQPAPTPPSSQPADGKPILARVLEVIGDVKYASIDSADWKPCKVDDAYPPETKLLTGICSSVKLQIGEEEPYTVMAVDSVGLTVISEATVTQDTKRVRVGVGYGRVKAGVAEGGLKSDFTVDSPVATLSKRGTWGFSLFYERGTDAFEIALADRGLVDALNKITAQQRTVNPGQYVTQAMRMWIDQVQFHNVAVPDILGQGEIEFAFNKIYSDGLGVTSPGRGRGLIINLSNETARNDFANLLTRNMIVPPLPPITVPQGPTVRPEGFFGTGRGDDLIPVLIDATSPLAQKGVAQPGRYVFRRSALENWLSSRQSGKRP